MNKLNLDDFTTRMSTEEIQQTENLIGGILGDCHCCVTETDTFYNCQVIVVTCPCPEE